MSVAASTAAQAWLAGLVAHALDACCSSAPRRSPSSRCLRSRARMSWAGTSDTRTFERPSSCWTAGRRTRSSTTRVLESGTAYVYPPLLAVAPRPGVTRCRRTSSSGWPSSAPSLRSWERSRSLGVRDVRCYAAVLVWGSDLERPRDDEHHRLSRPRRRRARGASAPRSGLWRRSSASRSRPSCSCGPSLIWALATRETSGGSSARSGSVSRSCSPRGP